MQFEDISENICQATAIENMVYKLSAAMFKP